MDDMKSNPDPMSEDTPDSPFDEAVACLDELCERTRGWGVRRSAEGWLVVLPVIGYDTTEHEDFATAVVDAAQDACVDSRHGGLRVSLKAPDGGGRKGRRVVRRQWRAFDPVEGPLDEPGWVEL